MDKASVPHTAARAATHHVGEERAVTPNLVLTCSPRVCSPFPLPRHVTRLPRAQCPREKCSTCFSTTAVLPQVHQADQRPPVGVEGEPEAGVRVHLEGGVQRPRAEVRTPTGPQAEANTGVEVPRQRGERGGEGKNL